jgi:hypothetical protein
VSDQRGKFCALSIFELSIGNRLLTNGAKVVSLRAPWITSAELYDSDEEAQSFQWRSSHSIWWQVFAAQSRSNESNGTRGLA